MSSTSPFPSKKGCCFALNKEGKPGSWKENLPKVLALKTSWTYSWGYSGYNELMEHGGKHLMWVPMSWGCPANNNRQTFEKRLRDNHVHQNIADGKLNLFFGFNEPDVAEQSNMKVEHALNLWPVLEKLNVPLVSPSCAHPGKEWMQTFMTDVKQTGKRVDYVGVHWYGPCNVNKFKADLTLWHDMYERPIIITEFAPADWKAKCVEENKNQPCRILLFMKEVLPWLEATEWIAGYSWFSFHESVAPGCSSSLFDADGQLTALGRYYCSVSAERPTGNRSIEAKEGPFHLTRGQMAGASTTTKKEDGNKLSFVLDKLQSCCA